MHEVEAKGKYPVCNVVLPGALTVSKLKIQILCLREV